MSDRREIKMMTDKQREFIEEIQAYVREKFNGVTMKDASEYISRNIEEYQVLSADSWICSRGYF